MLLTRVKKEQLVEEMTQGLQQSQTVLFVNFSGLRVKEVETLKKKLREQGIGFQIIKNNLLKIALKKSGIIIDEKLFDQPIAVCWGASDEVAPAKLTVEFGKGAENLKIVGALMNRNFIDVEIVKQLAALPGREELYAKLVGALSAPAYRLVNALQGNLKALVYILGQYKNSKQ